jgi:hypothetical protein
VRFQGEASKKMGGGDEMGARPATNARSDESAKRVDAPDVDTLLHLLLPLFSCCRSGQKRGGWRGRERIEREDGSVGGAAAAAAAAGAREELVCNARCCAHAARLFVLVPQLLTPLISLAA